MTIFIKINHIFVPMLFVDLLQGVLPEARSLGSKGSPSMKEATHHEYGGLFPHAPDVREHSLLPSIIVSHIKAPALIHVSPSFPTRINHLVPFVTKSVHPRSLNTIPVPTQLTVALSKAVFPFPIPRPLNSNLTKLRLLLQATVLNFGILVSHHLIQASPRFQPPFQPSASPSKSIIIVRILGGSNPNAARHCS